MKKKKRAVRKASVPRRVGAKKKAVRRESAGPAVSRAELTTFRKLLLRKKQTLVNEIEHISRDTLSRSQRDATGELSGYTFHQADVATDNYDREFSLGLATAEQRIIWEIDEALGRIQDRTFGNCLSCGKRIARRRLQALPYARYCIDCQKKEEIPS